MTTFEHWPQRAADWLAPYDNAKGAYPPEMNKTAYDRSLDVIRKLAERHRGDATVWGVEPVGGRAGVARRRGNCGPLLPDQRGWGERREQRHPILVPALPAPPPPAPPPPAPPPPLPAQVNEPWQMYPTEWIKQFYWDAYHITREAAKVSKGGGGGAARRGQPPTALPPHHPARTGSS